MSSTKLNLFDPFITRPELTARQHLSQEIIYYGESWFRSIMIACNQADNEKKVWMTKYIQLELVYDMNKIVGVVIYGLGRASSCSMLGWPWRRVSHWTFPF
jgi:hypothetical protein